MPAAVRPRRPLLHSESRLERILQGPRLLPSLFLSRRRPPAQDLGGEVEERDPVVGARHAAARLLVTLGEHLVRLGRTADAEKVPLPIPTRASTKPELQPLVSPPGREPIGPCIQRPSATGTGSQQRENGYCSPLSPNLQAPADLISMNGLAGLTPHCLQEEDKFPPLSAHSFQDRWASSHIVPAQAVSPCARHERSACCVRLHFPLCLRDTALTQVHAQMQALSLPANSAQQSPGGRPCAHCGSPQTQAFRDADAAAEAAWGSDAPHTFFCRSQLAAFLRC